MSRLLIYAPADLYNKRKSTAPTSSEPWTSGVSCRLRLPSGVLRTASSRSDLEPALTSLHSSAAVSRRCHSVRHSPGAASGARGQRASTQFSEWRNNSFRVVNQPPAQGRVGWAGHLRVLSVGFVGLGSSGRRSRLRPRRRGAARLQPTVRR